MYYASVVLVSDANDRLSSLMQFVRTVIHCPL